MPQPASADEPSAFEAQPLTRATWSDLEELFGLPGGAMVRGCWCMFYRKTGENSGLAGAAKKTENKQALCDLVDRGVVPGLVGYLDGSPAG
jgi:hypothetical protein